VLLRLLASSLVIRFNSKPILHHASMTTPVEQQALQKEITTEDQPEATEKKPTIYSSPNGFIDDSVPPLFDSTSTLHTLLLLSDSALPLGSFAFSSGLESYLAHHPRTTVQSQHSLLHTFLNLSLQSLAGTALPYVLAAYRCPEDILALDNDFDASTPCTVARRASVAQGKALMGVWERSFRAHYSTVEDHRIPGAIAMLEAFSSSLRTPPHGDTYLPNGHLPPLWGIITRILGLPLHDIAYLFLFSHGRTVISAAVRASVLGPYHAQSVLASPDLRDKIKELVSRYWDTKPEDAGQSVPVMDLWIGRHECLYSRIFNS
jgi:urease accessory protein